MKHVAASGATPAPGRKTMSSEAYVIIKQNECMRRFRQAGATDPARARTLEDLGLKPSLVFRKMLARDVFREGRAPETYFMDESAAEEFVDARRRRVFYMLLLMLALAAVLFFLGRR
jgi:hypothetical protein